MTYATSTRATRKPMRSTIRYAAKEAYKLAIMRGIYQSTIAGLDCNVFASEGHVYVSGEFGGCFVRIAKAWANL